MVVNTLPCPAGDFAAAVEFHDGRMLVPFPRFRTAEAAQAWGEAWIRDALAAHARRLAADQRHLQLVED
jgi:hypothetical protein